MRDIDVRTALHAKVLAEHHDDPNTLVLDELGLWYGLARVDIAVVNGRMHGYEIKSDRDTLVRLPEQARIYSNVLDRVTLVVGEAHAVPAMAIVPEWWGIKIVTRGPRGAIHFSEERPAQTNLNIDPVSVAALLWCDELLDILTNLNAARGVRGKSRDIMARRLAEHLPLSQLRSTVRERLKSRSGWRSVAPRT
jgi:hypothetical protein